MHSHVCFTQLRHIISCWKKVAKRHKGWKKNWFLDFESMFLLSEKRGSTNLRLMPRSRQPMEQKAVSQAGGGFIKSSSCGGCVNAHESRTSFGSFDVHLTDPPLTEAALCVSVALVSARCLQRLHNFIGHAFDLWRNCESLCSCNVTFVWKWKNALSNFKKYNSKSEPFYEILTPHTCCSRLKENPIT